MTIRILYILLFSFIAHLGIAQSTYTKQELQNFVQIYMSYKSDKKRDSDADKRYFEKHNVTPARYREIAKAAVMNDPLVLSPNEEQLILDLKKQNQFVEDMNKLLLNRLCTKNNTSHTKYTSILNQYQKDIRFQRSMKSYFDAYIKQMK